MTNMTMESMMKKGIHRELGTRKRHAISWLTITEADSHRCDSHFNENEKKRYTFADNDTLNSWVGSLAAYGRQYERVASSDYMETPVLLPIDLYFYLFDVCSASGRSKTRQTQTHNSWLEPAAAETESVTLSPHPAPPKKGIKDMRFSRDRWSCRQMYGNKIKSKSIHIMSRADGHNLNSGRFTVPPCIYAPNQAKIATRIAIGEWEMRPHNFVERKWPARIRLHVLCGCRHHQWPAWLTLASLIWNEEQNRSEEWLSMENRQEECNQGKTIGGGGWRTDKFNGQTVELCFHPADWRGNDEKHFYAT